VRVLAQLPSLVASDIALENEELESSLVRVAEVPLSVQFVGRSAPNLAELRANDDLLRARLDELRRALDGEKQRIQRSRRLLICATIIFSAILSVVFLVFSLSGIHSSLLSQGVLVGSIASIFGIAGGLFGARVHRISVRRDFLEEAMNKRAKQLHERIELQLEKG
jgi:hypothetical protein